MPKITEISFQKNNKSRCNIFVDDQFFSGLSLETVIKNRLKIGLDIDKQALLEIINESERCDALNKSIFYVSKCLKTKRQVKEYLLKKGYSEDVVWYCIDKLKEYKYIDDNEFSKRYIESVSKTQGKRLVEYKLMQKGIKKDDMQVAFSEVDIDAKENARRLAEKRMRNKEINKENLAKTYRYLIGRGFLHEEVDYAISQFKKDY